jgi:tetratricopeptide (TPR) repeat protein
VLTAAESRDLLGRRLGARRVAAEPSAVGEIIAQCARLPLALVIAAARAATHPDFPLHGLAAELRDSSRRLDALAGQDPATDVRAVFSWSYHALTPAAARLFRLIGLHPGPDISAPAAASLTATSLSRVRPLLAELASAHLIAEHRPGRYSCHDLMRGYAAGQARDTYPAGQRRAALHRVLDHYLHTAYTAERLMFPHRDPVSLAPPQPGTAPETLTDQEQAAAWCTAEQAVLLAAVNAAADNAFFTHTWQLAWAIAEFLFWRGHWRDLAAASRRALAAAEQLADPWAQAVTHRILGNAYARLDCPRDAQTHHRQAFDLYDQADDKVGQAHTQMDLTMARDLLGRHTEALDHARQALGLYQAAGHLGGQARALGNIGWLHMLLGDHGQALGYCGQALAIQQDLRDRQGQALTWDSIGVVHYHLGHYQEALTSYQRALDLHPHLANRYNEARILSHVGDAHHAAGDPHAARDSWRQALAILHDLGHPDTQGLRGKLAALDDAALSDPLPGS